MFYARFGQVPHKRHTQFRQPDGSLYHEELMGIHGFTGNKSLLYHLRPPTAVRRVEPGRPGDPAYAPPGPLRHRLLRTSGLQEGGDAVDGRVPLMGNQDVRVSVARPTRAMDYWYRYAHAPARPPSGRARWDGYASDDAAVRNDRTEPPLFTPEQRLGCRR